jgi:hypothetical protein
MKNKLNVLGIVIGLALVFSCNKYDFNKVSTSAWNPSIAAPIINSTLTVYNILAFADSNNLVVIDPATGLLALVYEGELVTIDAQQIVSLNNISDQQNITLTTDEKNTLEGPAQTLTITRSETKTYNTSAGVEIDLMKLKNGGLNVEVYSNFSFNGNLSVNVTIPGLTKNSNVFNQTVNVNNINFTTTNVLFDLTGYDFDLTNGNTTSNEFVINYSITFNLTSGTVQNNDNLEIQTIFSDLAFLEIYGDFGNQIINTDEDSVLIKIFSSAAAGKFNLIDPKINLTFENSFGFPMQIDFTQLESVSYTQTPNLVRPIQYNGNLTPFTFTTINAASSSSNPTFSFLSLNKDNSDIIHLIEPTPKFVHYTARATTNAGSSGIHDDFMTDQSKLTLKAEVELPLEGNAYDWAIVDTLPFEFGAGSLDVINELLLRINFDNGFPVDVRMQMFLTDENYNITDSLFNYGENFINSGIVNNDGRVIENTKTTKDVVLNKSTAQKFFESKNIIIWGKAESKDATSNKIVKIYEDYTFGVKLGIKVDGSIKLTN